MSKLKYIDALRGWAVLGVLLVHCGGYGTNYFSELAHSIVGNGGKGVQLFFIISAFTLFLSLSNRRESENGLYGNFFIRRFFRIAPMFYLAIIYFVAERFLYGYLSPDHPPIITEGAVISSFFFVHGFSPYWINNVVPGGWTIAVEMVFYCIVPFLFMRIKNMNHAVVFFLLTLFLQHVVTNLLKIFPLSDDTMLMKHFLYYYIFNQLPVFACGIFMFFLITVPKDKWSVSPVLLMLLSCGFLLQVTTGKELFSYHVLFSMVFVVICYTLSKREFKLLVNPVTRYIGKISFSMYLVHFIVLHWMTKLGNLDFISPLDTPSMYYLNFGVRFIILLLATVTLSSITYNLIENPFQKMGKRIINRMNDRQSL